MYYEVRHVLVLALESLLIACASAMRSHDAILQDEAGNRVYTLKVGHALVCYMVWRQACRLTLLCSRRNWHLTGPPPSLPTLLVSAQMISSVVNESLAKSGSASYQHSFLHQSFDQYVSPSAAAGHKERRCPSAARLQSGHRCHSAFDSNISAMATG